MDKNNQDNIHVEEKKIEEVEEFYYLRSIINLKEGTKNDMDIKLKLSRKAFNILNTICLSLNITKQN